MDEGKPFFWLSGGGKMTSLNRFACRDLAEVDAFYRPRSPAGARNARPAPPIITRITMVPCLDATATHRGLFHNPLDRRGDHRMADHKTITTEVRRRSGDRYYYLASSSPCGRALVAARFLGYV